ncbi:MAG TPA: hypothetical protein VN734_00685 [Acidobacteriaceae bacterium]|nr:hypothetical protein [Acidobacteriaceae bacterium]
MAVIRQAEISIRMGTPDAGVRSLPNVIKRLAIVVSFAVATLAAIAGVPARASVSLLLEQPYGGLGIVNPTGHAAVYLDHVCAASPLELRPCRPGELGVVISRYDDISHHDWIAVPLLPYLYAVESPADIPQTADHEQVSLLRELYRRHALESVAPDLPDGSAPDSNWYELAGSAYDRTIYGFSLATTPEQDARLIAMFNDRRNVERYNGAFRNCADFARTTINFLYPHAIRRNFVADFGLTTPKSVARALTHYASKHPALDFHVFKISQIPGSLPRSREVQGVTESLLKRYGVPLVVLSPIATGVVFIAYMGHGRFDMPRNAPLLDLQPSTLNLDRTTITEATELEPPASLSLPAPTAVAMRTVLPSSLVNPEGPPLALDTPLVDRADRFPVELFSTPATE